MILDWNPDRVLVSLGPVSIYWYGLLFVAGFLLGYWIMTWICKRENYPSGELDSLLIYLFVGTIVGARLGHVFFYEPQYFLAQPIEILKIWKGGLASHGGAIGLLLSFAFFIYMHPRNNVLWLMDRLCIPTALTAVFIRCGNFMNSEIVGVPTGSDYGVIFRQAHEYNSVPCHPVQLYEAAAYLFVFLLLFAGYLFNKHKKAGRPLGIWWNYPVTDYLPAKLALGPIGNLPQRDANAIFFNPMQYPELSKIALATGAQSDKHAILVGREFKRAKFGICFRVIYFRKRILHHEPGRIARVRTRSGDVECREKRGVRGQQPIDERCRLFDSEDPIGSADIQFVVPVVPTVEVGQSTVRIRLNAEICRIHQNGHHIFRLLNRRERRRQEVAHVRRLDVAPGDREDDAEANHRKKDGCCDDSKPFQYLSDNRMPFCHSCHKQSSSAYI